MTQQHHTMHCLWKEKFPGFNRIILLSCVSEAGRDVLFQLIDDMPQRQGSGWKQLLISNFSCDCQVKMIREKITIFLRCTV